MAFENGSNVYNYVFPVLKKYKEDTLVFMKALQFIEYSGLRNNLPYSIEDMDLALKKILGMSLTELSYGGAKYVLMAMDTNPENRIESGLAHWDITKVLIFSEVQEFKEVDISADYDTNLTKSFKNEFEAFVLAIKQVFSDMDSYYHDPDKIRDLAMFSSGDHIKLRITKNNSDFIEVKLEESDINYFIMVLENGKESF